MCVEQSFWLCQGGVVLRFCYVGFTLLTGGYTSFKPPVFVSLPGQVPTEMVTAQEHRPLIALCEPFTITHTPTMKVMGQLVIPPSPDCLSWSNFYTVKAVKIY